MIKISEAQSETEQFESIAPGKQSRQKSILALSIFALGLNAAAAAYTTSPSDFAWPDVGGLVAELLPHAGTSAPILNPVDVALNDIQSAQQNNAAELKENGVLLQQNAALLQQNGSSLQHNTALLQQDAIKLDALRSSLTDERSDVKTISAQLSTLIAKVDSLQNAMTSDMTSSISKGHARVRLSAMARKRLARPIKPEGPVSVGGVPLGTAPRIGGLRRTTRQADAVAASGTIPDTPPSQSQRIFASVNGCAASSCGRLRKPGNGSVDKLWICCGQRGHRASPGRYSQLRPYIGQAGKRNS
ncbi:MAG: hypothetical protein WDN50_05595 [Bradyrhizobium sp.]